MPVSRQVIIFTVCLTVAVTVGILAQTPPASPPATPAQGRAGGSPDTPGRGGGPPQPPRGGGRGRRTFDPAAIERAKAVYVPNCGFCHGADARGATQGPDLARSLLVYNDQNGKEIGALIRAGRADKGMPAFPNLTDTEIADIALFLHERVEAARSSAVTEAARQLVGNAAAGAVFFNGAGRCTTCHSVTGDLQGIGARYDVMALQDRLVNPRAGRGRGEEESPRVQKTAKVMLADGSTVSGRLIYISEFAVTLVDSAGNRRSFTRNGDVPKVEVVDPLQAHMDLMRTSKDADIHNLTAYLVTIK
jgi:cytochrome c oxidase cbb3-type subunit 3